MVALVASNTTYPRSYKYLWFLKLEQRLFHNDLLRPTKVPFMTCLFASVFLLLNDCLAGFRTSDPQVKRPKRLLPCIIIMINLLLNQNFLFVS